MITKLLLLAIAIAVLPSSTAFAQEEADPVEAQAPALPADAEEPPPEEPEDEGPEEGPGSRVPQFEAEPTNPAWISRRSTPGSTLRSKRTPT
jgi:hypothetical protein